MTPADFVIPMAVLFIGYAGSGIVWIVRHLVDHERRLAVIEDRLKIEREGQA